MKKIFTALCCCAALAACTQLSAQEPPYLLQTRGGELAYYDTRPAAVRRRFRTRLTARRCAAGFRSTAARR